MKKYLDPILIIGTFFSIVTSLILYFLGLESYPSTFIALLGIIVTLQIDQISRAERAVEKALYYSTYWRKIENVPWIKTYLENIIDDCNIINNNLKNDIFIENTQIKIEECRNYIQGLANGQLRTAFQDSQLMLRATKRIHTTLRAISVGNPKLGFKWWNQAVGKKYWEYNLEAVARGVHIERIFVYEEFTEELHKLIVNQFKNNVEVYLIESKQLSPDLRVGSIIFDDNFIYELHLSSDGQPIEHYYSINISDISQKVRSFETIKSLSSKFIMD